MRSLLVLVVLLLVVPAIHAQCGSQCDTVNAWRNTLFYGLTDITKRGVWSRLTTFKETSQVVLIGKNLPDGLIALATFGNGRVAVFGQDRHVQKFGKSEPNSNIKKLHANLLTWLQNGAAGTWKIGMPSSSSELAAFLDDSDCKTIVSHGGLWATDADDDQLKTWVEQGGTLVVGFDKTEFSEATDESAKHINFYSVLLEAGIAIELQSAPLDSPIPTAISDISALVELNLHNVANSLTWENFENNARLNYIFKQVRNYPRTYPHEVSRHILSVFEPFAYAMEENMVWPSATPPNDGPKESVTDREHAMYDVYYTLSLAHLWRDKAHNVDKFPGDVTDPPPTETASFSFQSRKYRHFFTTGYYFVAGQEMTITINNAPGDNTWSEFKMYCGIYTDSLAFKRYDIARFPRVAWKRNLVDRETTFKWPFGGLIYFWGPDGLGNSLDVTISGVIPSPYLDIVNDQDFDATWASRCQTKGLSADIRGDYVRFTLAADSGVCDMSGQQVKDVVEKWDKIVRKTEELVGASVSAIPEDFTQQSFTADIQTSGGLLHSGFPIVARVAFGYVSTDRFLLNGIWENMWGPYHELGHNYDQYYWIPSGSGETTNNVISYFCMERMTTQTWDNLTNIQDIFTRKQFLSWLASPSYESEYNDKSTRYLVYTQTVRDFGWSCQRDVLKSYLDDQAQGEPLPTENNEIMQQWVIRWSQTVGYNLCPLFGDFWKWPLDQSTLDTLANLSPYLPDDPVTQHADAAALTQSVVDAWPNLVRTVDTSSLTCNYFDIEPYV